MHILVVKGNVLELGSAGFSSMNAKYKVLKTFDFIEEVLKLGINLNPTRGTLK